MPEGNLDRLAEAVDELVHSVEQHHNDANQLALEIERLRNSITLRQQRMERLEAVVVDWRRRLAGSATGSGEGLGAEERRLAEERLGKLETALHSTRVLMEETERQVNQLTGRQQQQQQQQEQQQRQ